MTVSQNGWPANRRDLVSARYVPGTGVRLVVRNGAAGDLLLEVAAVFDLLVVSIEGVADDWGYAERPVRGSTAISNHASGTAIDLNATCWPLGRPATVYLDAKQIDIVRSIVAATGGVVRWGGDYTGRKDPMHFEINDGMDEADCARALAALRARYGRPGSAPSAPPAPARDEVDMASIEELRALIHAEVPGAVWQSAVPDYYPAIPDGQAPPTMPAWAALAWGTTHAAHARDEAGGAHAGVAELAKRIATGGGSVVTGLSDDDLHRVAAAVLDEQARRLAG